MVVLLDIVSPNTVGLILLAAIVALWLALGLLWPGRSSNITKFSKFSKSTESTQTLPSVAPASLGELPQKGWWTDASHFQLERRALFSRAWICVSHSGRFVKPGDYVARDLAGFRILLILGKDGVVRAFHNVCRHRAFPVARKAAGTAAVLACQYHGWTYNALGQLTTAPHFDQLPGFSRSENGLFPIRTRTDIRGFLHVNLSGEAVDDEVGEIDIESPQLTGRPTQIDKSSSALVYSWEAKGQFNWKIASGSEMYGAAATFSGVPISSGFFAQVQAALAACGLTPDPVGQLHFFPLATVHTREGSPFWCHIVCSPDSPQQTTVRCDVYATAQKAEAEAGSSWRFEDSAKGRLEARLRRLVETYERAYAELSDPVLGAASKDINSYDRSRIASLVQAHGTLERVAGREIHPAAVQQCRSPAFAQAESICHAMTSANSKLEW